MAALQGFWMAVLLLAAGCYGGNGGADAGEGAETVSVRGVKGGEIALVT